MVSTEFLPVVMLPMNFGSGSPPVVADPVVEDPVVPPSVVDEELLLLVSELEPPVVSVSPNPKPPPVVPVVSVPAALVLPSAPPAVAPPVPVVPWVVAAPVVAEVELVVPSVAVLLPAVWVGAPNVVPTESLPPTPAALSASYSGESSALAQLGNSARQSPGTDNQRHPPGLPRVESLGSKLADG